MENLNKKSVADLRDLLGADSAARAIIDGLFDNGTFAEFVAEMLENGGEYSDMTVKYKNFEVKYNEYFKLNGQTVDTDYGRYESDYVNGKVERKADVIEFVFDGKKLTLNYKEGKREQ